MIEYTVTIGCCNLRKNHFDYIYIHELNEKSIHSIKAWLKWCSKKEVTYSKYIERFKKFEIVEELKDLHEFKVESFNDILVKNNDYIVFDDFRKWFSVYSEEQFDYLFKECCLKDSTDIDFGLIEECDNMKKEFRVDERVRIVKIPQVDFLYEKTGTIMGKSFFDTYGTADDYIVLLDEPKKDAKCIIMTESCLERI